MAASKTLKAMDKAEMVAGTKDEAVQLDKEIVRLAKVTNETFIHLGEKLSEIMDKRLYRFFKDENGQPFSKFEDYVSARLGIETRAAFKRLFVYRKLCTEAGMSKDAVSQIPYSKALLVAQVADMDDVKDVEMWVEKAKGQSFGKFQEEAKWHKRKQGGSDTGEVLVLSLHFKLTSAQMDNVNEALKTASVAAESKKDGHLLDLICTSYMANEALKENVDDVGLKRILMDLERAYGLAILVVKDERVVFGSKKMLKVLGLDKEQT